MPNWVRSILAVLAGLALISALGAATDTALQYSGVLPFGRLSDSHAMIALVYHVPFAVLGCYVAARLAPVRPMTNALALGAIGLVISAAAQVAIVAQDMAPVWYGWALMLLSLPIGYAGGLLARWSVRDR